MNLVRICLAVLAGFVLGIMLRPSTVRAHSVGAVHVQKAKINGSITPREAASSGSPARKLGIATWPASECAR